MLPRKFGVFTEGQRVLIAVLTGDLAAIVERERAREAYREHVDKMIDGDPACPCVFDPSTGDPYPHQACETGQRLAAAVKAVSR